MGAFCEWGWGVVINLSGGIIKIMIVESSKTKELIDKEDIINYEYQILQQSTPQVKPNISSSHKYTSWDLDSKIREVVPDESYSIRWIGNSPNAYLETYAYTLLIGSGYSEASIVEFKHVIYQLGRKCLNLPEQKFLVQFLCLIEYSRDRYSYLSKYPQIEQILVKILQSLEKDQPSLEQMSPDSKNKAKVKRKTVGKLSSLDENDSGQLSSQEFQVELQLQEVYEIFNSHFQFITILGSNEYCCTLKLFNEKIVYIVIQKDCYFLVEPAQKVRKVSVFPDERNNVASDFDKIMNSQQKREDQQQEFQFNVIEPRRNNFDVQESSVIAVERASQIRKPVERQLKSTAKFAGFATIIPTQLTSQFEIHPDDKIEHDRTFIDELLTATVVSHENDTNRAIDSPKKNERRQRILQKMKAIQEMKLALKSVRERLQKKIKVIDEVENLKSEVALKIMQKNTPEISDYGENKLTTNRSTMRSPTTHPPKKDRKISYNEPTVFPKTEIEEALESRGSFRDAPAIFERVFSEKPPVRLNAQLNCINQAVPKKQRVYESPNIPRRMSPSSHSNVNVNVNLSINEALFRPYAHPSGGSYSRSNKFPTGKGGFPYYIPTHMRSLESAKYLRNNLHNFVSRPTNPEVSIKVVKSS